MRSSLLLLLLYSKQRGHVAAWLIIYYIDQYYALTWHDSMAAAAQ
jgi:hypothetical protein